MKLLWLRSEEKLGIGGVGASGNSMGRAGAAGRETGFPREPRAAGITGACEHSGVAKGTKGQSGFAHVHLPVMTPPLGPAWQGPTL